VGIGRNGKSKLLELITALLGKDNVSNQTIQSLCYNRFSLAELHRKLANISADLPSKELANTGIFKMIVGGDRLEGEHKHKDPFYFDNYAKLMFSCNRAR
jgi:putative DNA primase/helicase